MARQQFIHSEPEMPFCRFCLSLVLLLGALVTSRFSTAQSVFSPSYSKPNLETKFDFNSEAVSGTDHNVRSASLFPHSSASIHLAGIDPIASEVVLPLQPQMSLQSDSALNQSLFGDFRSLWDAAHQDHITTGFIDFNTYWDSRHFSVTTLNLLANLPNDFQYFQLLNFDSPINTDSHDLVLFFTEMNLRRAIAKNNPYLRPLDWTIQYADGSVPHGVLRFGCRWRLQDTPNLIGTYFKETLNLNYSINFHLVETDGTGWQIEHVYRKNFFDGKIYVAGFCDHNINDHGRNSTWVTEHQVGLQVFDSFYVVAEHRYNSFLPSGFRQGLGIGLEYVMRFKSPK